MNSNKNEFKKPAPLFWVGMTIFNFVANICKVKNEMRETFKSAHYCILNGTEKMFYIVEDDDTHISETDKLHNKEAIRNRSQYVADKEVAIGILLSQQFCSTELASAVREHELFEQICDPQYASIDRKILQENLLLPSDAPYMIFKDVYDPPENETLSPLSNAGPRLAQLICLIRNYALGLYRPDTSEIESMYGTFYQQSLDFNTYCQRFAEATAIMYAIDHKPSDGKIRNRLITNMDGSRFRTIILAMRLAIQTNKDMTTKEAIKAIKVMLTDPENIINEKRPTTQPTRFRYQNSTTFVARHDYRDDSGGESRDESRGRGREVTRYEPRAPPHDSSREPPFNQKRPINDGDQDEPNKRKHVQSRDQRIKCFSCNQYGHYAADCPFKAEVQAFTESLKNRM